MGLLVGCGGDDERSDGSAPGLATVAPVAPPGLREQGVPDQRQQAPETVDRKEVVSGNVEITSGDPIGAAAQVIDQVRRAGGRVDSRTEQPGTDDLDPSASLTVRVPADKTDEFLDGLGGLGTLTSVTVNRDDVTMQWEDLDARIAALRASVDRLRALIETAADTADLLAAEEALSDRQGELDSLVAQKRRLDDQVALSTLTIQITTDAETSSDDPSNFFEGLAAGWNSFVDWGKDAIVFVGKAIPWVGFLAVLGAIGYALVRVIRRKSRSSRGAHAQGAGAPASAPTETGAPAGSGTATPTGSGTAPAESGTAPAESGTAAGDAAGSGADQENGENRTEKS
ncbi:uncharacterized protein DUF4349 [Nocardia puris]|uniref:Uncharacterized protein DUF4349 n=2 Tax=Nocardia puris TaxID=208602 RepID=A0A366DFH4_9NOCA|nr:uncharacterized protein DUF4349 [Nocardia puris]